MTQTLIIDPPVSPYGRPEELRAWIDRLGEIRKSVERNPVDVALVDREAERAQEWLRRAESRV